MKRLAVFLSLLAASFIADAKVVAWYRFEETPSGTGTSGETVFTNTIDAAKYPAYPRVCTANGNNKYNPANPKVLTSSHERMPVYTNAFPSDVSICDTVGFGGNRPGREYHNNSAIDLRNLADENTNPSGLILIDDHEDLRPKSFTLEFFMRSNKSTKNFRTLAVRTAKTYSTKEAFRLWGLLYNGGGMYLQGGLNTLGVTNTVTMAEEIIYWKINASSTAAIVDDNRWHHIALTVDNETKKACIYIDYVLRGSTTFVGEIFYEEGYPFALGGDPQCSYYNMFMAIDEIRFCDEPLTPERFLRYRPKRDLDKVNKVDSNTLFFFDFDDPFEQVVYGEGDMKIVHTNYPFLANKAINPLYSTVDATLSSFTFSGTWTNRFTPVRNTLEVPNSQSRFGITGNGTIENTASCHVITNSPYNDNSKRIILPSSVTREALFGDSLTIEGYFMVPNLNELQGFSSTLGNTIFLCMNGAFAINIVAAPGAWSYGYIFDVSIGGNKLQGRLGGHPTYTYTSYADGKWHHFALVYDRDTQEGFFYMDGKLELKGAVPSPFSDVKNGYVKEFLMGTPYWEDHYITNFRFDNIRISRGALKPYQFMTTISEETLEYYASASFENNFVMQPYTNFFGEAGAAAKFIDEGVAPICEKVRPAKKLSVGKNGTLITEDNRHSVRINGGAITYPDRALIADSDEFTVQFFLKMDSLNVGAGIARVNRGSSTLVTNAVTWALSVADSAGNLTLKVDTEAEEGQEHSFNVAVSCGNWHHVAMQFGVEDGNSVVKMYRDYELIDTWTVQGRIITRPRFMNFMLGAGEDPAAAFNGWIDELRITPGIVPVDEFIYPLRKGLRLIVR